MREEAVRRIWTCHDTLDGDQISFTVHSEVLAVLRITRLMCTWVCLSATTDTLLMCCELFSYAVVVCFDNVGTVGDFGCVYLKCWYQQLLSAVTLELVSVVV